MGLFDFGSDSLSDEDLEKIDVLNQVKLFENCAREDLKGVARHSEFKDAKNGDVVIKQGDRGQGMYMIDSGVYNVTLGDDSGETVATFEAGDYFGEMALLEDKERSANVICKEPGRLLCLAKDGFFELLSDAPKTAGKVLFVLSRTLSRRLRDTNRKLREAREE
ncbi:MAG: cyclic nucleotide-binding domain-containing protein [bacterium]